MKEETIMDVLAEISKHLDRIASALEAYNNAAICQDGVNTKIEIYTTNHDA